MENRTLRTDDLNIGAVKKFFLEQPPSARNRPVANLSFALQIATTGFDPSWFRFINVMIHALNIFLLAVLFMLCLDMVAPGRDLQNQITSLSAAALWGASPLHTESVTYIVQRETSLSALFFLAACVVFLNNYSRAGKDLKKTYRGWFLPAMAGLFLLSAGTKENGLLLPFALSVLIWILPRVGNSHAPTKGALVLAAAGFVLILGLGLILAGPGALTWRRTGPDAYGPIERVLTQPRVLIWYLSLLLVPLPGRLSLDIAFPASRGLLIPPTTLLAAAFWITAAAFAVMQRKKYPIFAIAVLWYLALSSMESSFLNLEMAFLHRTYLPSAFFFLLATDLILNPPKLGPEGHFSLSSTWRKLFILLLVFCLSLLLTVRRNEAYSSGIALWSDAAYKAPGKARPRFNLGRAFHENGKTGSARDNYLEAIRLDPGYFRPYANLAILSEDDGDLQGAWALMTRADQLHPGNGDVLYNLGRYSFMRGEFAGAKAFLTRSIQSREQAIPGDSSWYLALIAEEEGDLKGARAHWARAAREYGENSDRGREALARAGRLE